MCVSDGDGLAEEGEGVGEGWLLWAGGPALCFHWDRQQWARHATTLSGGKGQSLMICCWLSVLYFTTSQSQTSMYCYTCSLEQIENKEKSIIFNFIQHWQKETKDFWQFYQCVLPIQKGISIVLTGYRVQILSIDPHGAIKVLHRKKFRFLWRSSDFKTI